MTFAAPWWLVAGAAAALAVMALHLLTRRDQGPQPLPTARFIPATPIRAVHRALMLTDRGLLSLRLLALLVASVAFAQPSLSGIKRGTTQVILVDTSEAADSIRIAAAVESIAGNQARLIRFSSLSAGFIAAIGEARAIREESDSVSLAIVSPLARESFDAATLSIRATWPGGIVWIPVDPIGHPDTAYEVALRAAADDPIRATLALGAWRVADSASTRLVRTSHLTAADSTWTTDPATPRRLLIHWPANAAGDDSVGAVATDQTVIATTWLRPTSRPEGIARAWWVDGAIAAADRPLGAGCIREIAIPIDDHSDLPLRPVARDLVRDLLVPCSGRRDARQADSATIAQITDTTRRVISTAALPPLPRTGRPLAWLLALAIAMLVAEQLLRRRPQ